MKLLFKLEDINMFDINENDFVFERQNLIYLNNKFIYKHSDSITQIGVTNNYVFITNALEQPHSIIFNKENKEIEKGPYVIKLLTENSVYFSENGVGKKKIIGSCDYSWELKEKFFLETINNDLFFYRSNKVTIKSINDINGTLLWQYTTTPKYDYRYTDIVQQEIEEKARISSVLGVYRDLVWLVLDIGVVIALDKSTGQEVHVLRVPDGHEEEYFTYSKNSILDEKTGIIFGAMGHFYWEIDISKAIPTYALFDIKESCDKHDIQVSDLHKAWDGADRLFVIQGGESNRVGYLSRKTKAIVWSTAIDEAYDKWPALCKVEYGGGRLYVLDHDNTLHVYGEENETIS